jgi:TP901 family phage tail tape measure protein
MANRKVKAELEIEGKDKTSPAFRSVATRMGQIERQMSRFNKTASGFEKTIRAAERVSASRASMDVAMGRSSAAALAVIGRLGTPAALAAATVYATKAAANFEESLFNIQKKSGATTEQMAKLREEILGLSKEMPVSMSEIASAFERGAAAGVPLDELREFSKLSAGVADAWDTTAENVGNTFAGFVAGMGMQRKDLQAFASLINDLADSGIADETGIADFIDRAGASLKNFGMTPEEIAAYGAALLNLKMPAEVGARAMDSLTGKLLAPENLSPKARTALTTIVGDLGKFEKLAGNNKLIFFLQQVEKLSNQRRASLLGGLLGEGFNDEIMRLVAGSDELRRNLGMAQQHVLNPSNSIVSVQTKKLELFNSQLTILQNNLRGIATASGETFVLPWLTEAMKQVNEAISDLDKRRAAVKGQSMEEVEQNGQKFLADYRRDNPGASFGSYQKAYKEALKLVGEGKLADVHEYNIQRREDKAYRERVAGAKDQYALYGQGRAGVNNVPEFPGGGTGLPPIPKPRPSMDPERFRVLRENYDAYNEGRAAMNSVGDVSGVLLSDKVSRALADSNRMIEESISGAAANLGDGGREAGAAIENGGRQGASAFSGVADEIRRAGADAAAAISSAIAKAMNQRPKGAPLANGDVGRTFPPDISKPGGGGW